MRATLRPFLIGLVGALLGSALGVLAMTLYADHVALRQLVTFINAHAAGIAGLK